MLENDINPEDVVEDEGLNAPGIAEQEFPEDAENDDVEVDA